VTDGTWLYRGVEPHVCPTPPYKDTTYGSVWVCDCGQHWHARDTWVVNLKWIKVSPKKAQKVLAKTRKKKS